MRRRVWVTDWEQQCCGTPFRVGDTVSWTVTEPDQDRLEDLLGADAAREVQAAETHHSDPPGAEPVTGRVVAVRAVRYRAVPDPDRPGGDGQVGDVERLPAGHLADGWEARTGKGSFTGYLVDLEVGDPGAAEGGT